MKHLIICILILFPILSNAQLLDENNFYNVSNKILNIHKVANGEYIFFGDEGGIVRTYDFGKTWAQNYSGTKNNILQLANNGSNLVGITDKNEFMASQDKGSHWFVKKINELIKSIDANMNYIFLSTGYRKLIYSDNLGASWKDIIVENDSLNSVFILEDRLFVATRSNKLLYSDNLGNSWNEVILPPEVRQGGPFKIEKIENKLYLIIYGNIYSIDKNLDIVVTKYNYPNTSGFYPSKNGFVLFKGETINNSYTIVELNTNNDSKTELSKYSNNYFNSLSFLVADVIVDDNLIFITSFAKTILKSEDFGKTWEVISYLSFFDSAILDLWDENNWSVISDLIRLKSTNAGATFKPSYDVLIDTNNVSKIKSFVYSHHYFNQDSAIYFLIPEYHNSKLSNCYTTNDGGSKLIPANEDLIDQYQYVTEKDDYLIVGREADYLKTVGMELKLFKMTDNFQLDSINFIDSIASRQYKFIEINNKIYIFYTKVNDNRGNSRQAVIAVSEDSLKTIEDLHIFNSNIYHSFELQLKSKNGNIYFNLVTKDSSTQVLRNYSYYRLDTKTDKLFESREFALLSRYGSKMFAEDQIFSAIGLTGNQRNYKFTRVSFEDNEMIIDTIGDNEVGKEAIPFLDGSGYILGNGGVQGLYKQIEPDRLTSVEQIESRTENPPIYLFAPIPNPAKEKIKVKFYIDTMESIDKLKVNLVNIATGIKVEIKDYDISFTNNWNGEISFDITDFSIGSYLINFSIDDYNRSSKLIIMK